MYGGCVGLGHLRARLLTIINEKEDSLRFYYLDQDVKIEHHGTNSPIDMDGPLVV